MPALSSRREAFIRFVVGAEHECADTLDGLFVMSRIMRDRGQLEDHEQQWLDEIYAWFNTELPCPPFSRRAFPADAVCWFRSSATQFVERMWDIVALLREHAVLVRLLTSVNPGDIVYQDSYQIVAVPWHLRRSRYSVCSRRSQRRECTHA